LTMRDRLRNREERANEMRRRAWELVTARGTPAEPGVLECTNVGMMIQYTFFSNTHRLSISTKGARVLVVEWWNSGKSNVVTYIPGLWETRLKHLTRGAL
jgi:hypothetical protein